MTEWANLDHVDHRIISEAVGHWCERPSDCVRANHANGGHFEH